MTKLPKINIGQHRGTPHFWWRSNGKPRYRKIKDPSNIEAERLQLAVDLTNGGGTVKKAKPQKTLADHIQDFHADLLTRGTAKHAGMIRKRIEATFREAGIKDVSEITAAKCRTAIAKLRCTTQKAENAQHLSEQSRYHYSRACKEFCKWLDDEGRHDNPLRKWKLKKVVEERNPRDRLQPDELKLLVTTTYASTRVIGGYDGRTRGWLYLLASMTGLRRSELAALAPSSFDLEDRIVTVQAGYTKAKKQADLDLHSRLVQDLREWLATVTGPLFPGLASVRTCSMIKSDLRAAGLPFRTETGCRCFHSLRNTYISSLFDAGLTIDEIQRRARHANIQQTMKYAKPRADEASRIDAVAYPGLS